MSLETILKPFKTIDEDIHRSYEEIGIKLDNKDPRLRYATATVFNGVSLVYMFPPKYVLETIPLLLGAVDLSLNWLNSFEGIRTFKEKNPEII